MPLSLIHHPDKKHRCSWCNQGEAFADYITYHDDEWGMPVRDERRLFEKITLEGFQSGLSWITVLRKRERFRWQRPVRTNGRTSQSPGDFGTI